MILNHSDVEKIDKQFIEKYLNKVIQQCGLNPVYVRLKIIFNNSNVEIFDEQFINNDTYNRTEIKSSLACELNLVHQRFKMLLNLSDVEIFDEQFIKDTENKKFSINSDLECFIKDLKFIVGRFLKSFQSFPCIWNKSSNEYEYEYSD